MRRVAIFGVLACFLALVGSADAARPPIKQVKLAYWPERVSATRDWSRLIHGTAKFTPRLIVQHWTGSTTQKAAIDYWNDSADIAWTHFMIDPRGQITQLAPLNVLAKHATGVSPWAIGIEHVGVDARDIMSNRRERRASYRLTCWLRERLRIPLRGVIGHGEVTNHPRFRLTAAGQQRLDAAGYTFHRDFSHGTMLRYRKHLRAKC